jgi:protein-tyrosine phosphatase
VIDLHCHILPALDDGALDLADSVAMARQAAADEIGIVCATPHIRDDHDVRIEELPQRIAELQQELDRRSIAVRIAQGGEVAQFAADGLSAEHLQAVSLDGGGWILLEPAPGALADELPPLVERLAERGVRTLLAHPERHAGEGFEQRLRALSSRGCLIQWTADFIASSQRGESDAYVLKLARNGFVHVLASDAHSSHGGRPVALSAAVERLRGVCTGEQLDWIVRFAPEAILRGEQPLPPW